MNFYQKITNILKILKYLIFEKHNEVRNIILKYPDLFFLNSSNLKNEILRGFYTDAPLNGQKIRKQIVENIITEFKPDFLIETGTYFGNTLEFFLKFNIPTFSIEINEQFYFIAKSRFINKDNENLNLVYGDSAKFLNGLDFNKDSVFAYLDAHWYENLPLDEELKILSNCEQIIILIDDFMVPDSFSWKFDKYNSTNLSLQSVNIPKEFSIYFPSYKPEEDLGMGTGCIWLAKGESAQNILNKITNIYRYDNKR